MLPYKKSFGLSMRGAHARRAVAIEWAIAKPRAVMHAPAYSICVDCVTATGGRLSLYRRLHACSTRPNNSDAESKNTQHSRGALAAQQSGAFIQQAERDATAPEPAPAVTKTVAHVAVVV